MSDIAQPSAPAHSGTDPWGPKPSRITPARIGIYAFLVVAALAKPLAGAGRLRL